jgi:hypothetical protein
MEPLEAARKAIDSVVAALYASISFPPGGRPDLTALRAVMLPGARLVHVKPEGPDVMDVGTFVERFERQLAAGTLRAVDEREIAARTDVFGGVAQRFSTYAGRFDIGGQKLDMRGINAIHLVRDAEGWRVASLVWDDELVDRPIPDDYLPSA